MQSKYHFTPCEAFHVARPAMREAMGFTLRGEDVPVNLKDWHPRGKEIIKVR